MANKEEKIQKIEELVANYNERHKLTMENTENAGRADFYHFNSTDEVIKASADSNEPVTEADWGLEPDTEYFEVELYEYRELTDDEVESLKPSVEGEIPEKPWYVMQHKKQYLSKDLNYFLKQITKVLSE
jgi:hypothetical protein